MTVPTGDIAAAYTLAAEAWGKGPARIYDVLAEELVARSPVPLSGRRLLDVGAGRGAATRAVERAGGRAVPVDVAVGMLAATAGAGGPAGVAADGRRLPFADGSVDGVIGAFSYNHLPDPARALQEAARVTRPGGVVLASAYASDDTHPVKAAVEAAAGAAGWQPDPWIAAVGAEAVPRLATVERARAVVEEAGLPDAQVERVDRAFPDLGPDQLVEWRMGMANVASFLAGLDAAARAAVAADARARLGTDVPVLVRRTIAIAAVVP